MEKNEKNKKLKEIIISITMGPKRVGRATGKAVAKGFSKVGDGIKKKLKDFSDNQIKMLNEAREKERDNESESEAYKYLYGRGKK